MLSRGAQRASKCFKTEGSKIPVNLARADKSNHRLVAKPLRVHLCTSGVVTRGALGGKIVLIAVAMLMGRAAIADEGSYYYCASAKAYFPYVKTCPEPWRAVPIPKATQPQNSPPADAPVPIIPQAAAPQKNDIPVVVPDAASIKVNPIKKAGDLPGNQPNVSPTPKAAVPNSAPKRESSKANEPPADSDDSTGRNILVIASIAMAVMYFRRKGRQTPQKVHSGSVKTTGTIAPTPKQNITFRVGSSGAIEPHSRPKLGQKPDFKWIPPGEPITINGFNIADGMVYVGKFLPASTENRWSSDMPAPCLINPDLKVASGPVHVDIDMGYWPSYSSVSPEHRQTYLTWLAGGKSDTNFPAGYAFLYFYGIERRLLLDNPPPEEQRQLISEVARLQSLFSSNSSFNRYSTSLIDIVELVALNADPTALENWKPDLDALGDEMPWPLRIKLATRAANGTLIDFDHAMAAMLTMSQYQGGIRRSVALTRTRPEFLELARRRFPKRFPDGFKLRNRKDSRLRLSYHPASQNLDLRLPLQMSEGLPDPLELTWTKMTEFCEKITDDLAAYARVVGKDRVRANTLQGAVALPAEIADLGSAGPFKDWIASLPGPIMEVPLRTLSHKCFGENDDAITPSRVRSISSILAAVGYGMEPDPTYGGVRPDSNVFLFDAADASGVAIAPSGAFHHAALILGILGPAVSEIDGANVVSELVSRLKLNAAEAARLTVRLRSMSDKSLPVSRLKPIGGKLTSDERTAITTLAAVIAGTFGDVNKATMASLERLHDAFGIERRDLYAVLHQRAAAGAARSSEPIVVEARKGPGKSFAIPPAPLPAGQDGTIVIDMAKVNAILHQTREVAQVLAPIYDDEDDEPPQRVKLAPVNGGRFEGLDAGNNRLLEALCSRQSWSRAEFEDKAREFGLMPNGAIEAINEWAYDTLDDEVIEDGDPVTINLAILPATPERMG